MSPRETTIEIDSSDEESILEQFVRLHKYLERAKQNQSYHWDVIELLNHFITASGYELSEEETDTLFRDIKSTADLLETAEELINSKVGDQFSDEAKSAFEKAFVSTCNVIKTPETMNNLDEIRDIFTKISFGMSIVALGAAVTVFAVGLSPLIMASCLITSVALLAASAATHYYQTNCTFFGQTQLVHQLMTDLIVDRASEIEPKAVGCFG